MPASARLLPPPPPPPPVTVGNAEEIVNKPSNNVSQEKQIKGNVRDQTGEPVIGAMVTENNNKSNGTVTDIDGNFTLKVSDNAIITISYMGLETQEVNTSGKTSFNIFLKDDVTAAEEVVVVGYGTQKKADLTGSVAHIDASELNAHSNSNISSALQGKIAGVDIVSQGGKPGSGNKIMVRGIGTLNNSSPLFIVDGMYMSGIDHLNPSDIERIDVLKDASSAAIYGSRAANGVIIITTKSGKDTAGIPLIDISVNVSISTPSKYLDMLNAQEWANVMTVSLAAIGKPTPEMAQNLADKPDNDWQRIMLNPALTQNYNVSIRGGGKNSTYYTGIGYLNQDGVVDGTQYQRYNLTSKNDYTKGIFSAGINIIMTMDKDKPVHQESRGGMIGTILQTVPTLEKYDSSREGGYGGTYGDVVNLPHPLGIIDDNIFNRLNESFKLYANAYLELKIIKGLKYKLNVTPDMSFGRYNNFINEYDFGLNANETNGLSEEQTRSQNILIENLLSYDRVFGDHNISALVGYTFQNNNYRYLSASVQGLPEGIYEIEAATGARTNNGYSSTSALTSILGRVFYSYKYKYLLTATIRQDGSSKFSPQNRYALFPSVSLGWNIAQENFLSSVDWLNQLKIRAGYGVLGNQEIGNYLFSSFITTGINYPDGLGGLIQGAFPKSFANPDIKWEETAMINVGLDFAALQNRLSLIMDWYQKNTTDILLTVPIPISSGGANDPIRNAGEIKNLGFEFNLGWSDNVGKDFSYGVNVLGNFNSNEVIKLGTGDQVINSGSSGSSTITTSRTLTGYPIGGYWLIQTDGYFNSMAEVNAYSQDGQKIQPAAQPGDIRFIDANGDGVINDEDRVYLGSPFPDFTYSLNGNIQYKNFDASFGFQGVVGNKIYNGTKQTLEGVNKGTNFLSTTSDYWTPDNLDAIHPRLVYDDPNRNTREESDRWLEDGSYFRLRNIQVGYTFPRNMFKGKIKTLRLYFSADNLFTITNYSGYSPDVNSGNVNSRGYDNFIYPNNKTFMFGLNASF